jgi:phenylalanyl-tRNA synthetase beta chain
MRAPVSWIREYADLPAELSSEDLARKLTALGLKLESLERPGAEITGPLVIGRVLTMEPEAQTNGKTINWCTVDVGPELNTAHGTGDAPSGVGIVCGAHNFAPGDLVVVVLPGGVLPGPPGSGGVEISARKTYGHVSAGMICSAQELSIGEDHDGIIVLAPDAGRPGDDARPVLGLDEEVIEFEINPDRAYALSVRGVAREAAMGFDTAYTDPCHRPVPAANSDGYPVRVEDPAGCPVFVARTVTGFDPTAPSPDWLQRRVRLAGMRPISLAVDVTNYVMLETGRPIHGYDGDRLQGPLVVRRATAGERVTTLDGVDRALSPEDLVVCDDSGAIGIGGVMGGETTEMSSATTTVVIESAHWDAVSMFRTGKRHKLTSEAGKRNERGVDPTICQVAADRVAELLTTYGGGTVAPGVTVVGTPPERAAIPLRPELPGQVAGLPIEAARVVEDLRRIDAEVAGDASSGLLAVTPPPWRPDLNDPYDLVEEVVRLVGYDQVPSVIPVASGGRGLTREQRLRRRIGRTLATLGCVEVVSFPFVGDQTFDALGLPDDDVLRQTVRLANPLSTEKPLYTTTLLPGVLDAAARNLGHGATGVALFETGTVAFPAEQGPAPVYGVEWRPSAAELDKLFEAIPAQPLFLASVLSGERDPAGWWGDGRPADWSDAVEIVRELGRALGVDVRIEQAERMPWHPRRCARVHVGDEELGHAGELHPRVCEAFGVPRGTAALEIDLDLLMSRAVDIPRAPVLSQQPLAKEDVALVVDESVSAAAVEDALRAGAGALLESIRLFDVYTGPQVGVGRKSLAFALRFRAPDRTLTETETAAAREAAVATAAERVGAVQR